MKLIFSIQKTKFYYTYGTHLHVCFLFVSSLLFCFSTRQSCPSVYMYVLPDWKTPTPRLKITCLLLFY